MDTRLTERLADGGPRYAETDLDRIIAEPWNAASALLFLVIVAYWIVKLRGRYRQAPFLTCCLPLLAAGGIGGTLYHAFRSSRFFFLLDVLPIGLLCLAVSIYLWIRLSPRWWHLLLVLAAYGATALARPELPTPVAINLSYIMLALFILLPLGFFVWRTRGRDAGWVALALGCFVVAIFFRAADAWWPLLPMGTHWLWHVFGAGACAALAEYLYRLETAALRSPAPY